MNKSSILEEIQNLISSMISGVIGLIPRIIIALIVLLIGFVVAKVCQVLIRRFIVYIDRVINENLQKKVMKIDLGNSAMFISKTVFWIILIFFFAIVTQVLGITVLTNWFEGLVKYLPNILAAVVIVFVGIIVGRLVNDLINAAARRVGIPDTMLGTIAKYVVIGVTIILAIDQVGFDIAFLTQLVAIVLAALLFGAALAFGLGARTAVSNILGSYYVQRSFKEGSTIKINDTEGVIIKITATNILLETKTGQVSIPAKLFNEQITILSKK